MTERKVFAGKTLAEAENAANDWWARQTGLERIGDCAAPVGIHLIAMTEDRWMYTVLFRKFEPPVSN
jgi:hypothetical protein